MTRNSRTLLSSVTFLLIAVALEKCEVEALHDVDFTGAEEDAPLFSSITDHSNARRLTEIHLRKEEPFFHVLLASLIVAVATLAGLLSLIPVLMRERWSCFKSAFWIANRHVTKPSSSAREFFQMGTAAESMRYNANNPSPQEIKDTATLITDIFVPSFASGAILATVLFLSVPEAILLIQRGTSTYKGEIEIVTGTVARFGVALMVGYALPLFLGALFPRASEYTELPDCEKKEKKEDNPLQNEAIEEGNEEEEEDDGSQDSQDEFELNGSSDEPQKLDLSVKVKKERSECLSLASCIFIGDATRNFLDGIFIGAAFMTCSYATAICITVVTIYTEVSQQMADYFLLANAANISIPRSLLLVFGSGLAVVIGSLVILGCKPGELAVGVFLSFASGVYLHTAASECLPRLYSVVKSRRDRLWALVFFALGAIPVACSIASSRTCSA